GYTNFPPAKSEFHKPAPTDGLDCQVSLGFQVALSITLEFILTGTLALNPYIAYDITIAQNAKNNSVYDTTGVLSINFDIYVQGTLGIVIKGKYSKIWLSSRYVGKDQPNPQIASTLKPVDGSRATAGGIANLDQTTTTPGPKKRRLENTETDKGCLLTGSRLWTISYSKGIDQQSLSFTLSAFLGGVAEQEDDAKVVVLFLNNDYHTIQTEQIGPVSAKDRQDKTSLLNQTKTGVIKSSTRYINVYLILTRKSDVTKYGTNNDGNADDIVFMITQNGE
ncbi:unnamed protein product, partial [Didymodactylos carnosus]